MIMGSAEKLGFDSSRLTKITDWMQRYVDEEKFPGSSILINRHGEEVFYSNVGYRDVEEKLLFQRDTIVRIFSMTKLITSVALMTLVEKGLFPLEAPVSEFVPSFKNMRSLVPNAKSIDETENCETPTIHQLLTHTSGLSYSFNPGLVAQEMSKIGIFDRSDEITLQDAVKELSKLPLCFKPGAKWEYSVSIDLLGRVIEIVSGKSLDIFLRDEIFQPLGMQDTAFNISPCSLDRFSSLYSPVEGKSLELIDQRDNSPYQNPLLFSGGGGLVGTIDDYMKFGEMICAGGICKNHRVLSKKTLEFMRLNHLRGDIASLGPESFAEQPMDGMGFGLGGAVVLNPGLTRIPGSVGDFGWGGMASTFFWTDPIHNMSIVFFTQLSPSSSYSNRAELKALVHSALGS